jgi:hypothetical protein
MKTNFKPKSGLGGQLRSAGAALFLLSGLAAVGQPFASPVGRWDVVMSGPRSGVAVMTFNPDQTISMTEVLVPKAHKGSGANDTRGDNSGDSRDGSSGVSSGASNGLPAHADLFGTFEFPRSELRSTNTDVGSSIFGSVFNVLTGEAPGQWGFDSAGRVIGFFTEVSAHSAIVTNVVPLGTNSPPFTDSIATNPVPFFLTNVSVVRITNAISFIGKVTAGKKLALVCSTPDGRATFTGLVPIPLTDISGEWFGTKMDQGLPYTEFFHLFVNDPSVNLYDVIGSGPGYDYGGTVIVSRQKKIGFGVSRFLPPEVPLVVRAVFGSVDLKRVKFSALGLENKQDGTLDRVSFKAGRSAGPD